LTDIPDASGKKYRREIIELAPKKAMAGSTTSTRTHHRQDRTQDHLHPARRRRRAGSRHLQKMSGGAMLNKLRIGPNCCWRPAWCCCC
jgi:hypothetical protein